MHRFQALSVGVGLVLILVSRPKGTQIPPSRCLQMSVEHPDSIQLYPHCIAPVIR